MRRTTREELSFIHSEVPSHKAKRLLLGEAGSLRLYWRGVSLRDNRLPGVMQIKREVWALRCTQVNPSITV